MSDGATLRPVSRPRLYEQVMSQIQTWIAENGLEIGDRLPPEREVAGGGRGVEGDERFHAAVTAAGHSRLLAKLMAEISDLIRDTRISSLSQPGRPANSLKGHRKIADAIRARDSGAAAAAMQEHVAMVSDVALLNV